MTSVTGTEAFAVDGTVPGKVVKPTTLPELSTALGEAHSAGEAVVPWGGGTRMHVGNLPERYTTALDLTGLSAGIQHESGDLTVFADAGVTIERLRTVLAEQGQRLPFDVPEAVQATLGGSVASNAAGQMRSSLGGIRDWIIGIKVVLADGTVTKAGGRVVKNVQGYDLHRLHTGAFGTLGVIAEVALKVVPIPAHTSTIAAWFGSVEDAGDFAMQVFNGPAVPEALTIFNGRPAAAKPDAVQSQTGDKQAGALVLALVSCGADAVTRLENDLTGAAGTAGANGYEVLRGDDSDRAWGAGESEVASDAVEIRATLKPTDAIRFLARTSESADAGTFGGELQAGFGTVSISVDGAGRNDIDRVEEIATSLGGRITVERCPVELKHEIDVFGKPGPELALTRSVKQQFDPNRVLNPGRFAGRI